MDALVDTLAASGPAQAMRSGRWVYAAVSGGHVLAIALLVGAIVSLDLRLAGLWRSVPVHMLGRVLVPVAATGLGAAVVTGGTLFLAAPHDYLDKPLFPIKIILIFLGAAHAVWVHASGGFDRRPGALQRIGLTSLMIWVAVLTCGRMLAFVA